MKKVLVILVLCLAFGSAVLSAPNVVIYRYQDKGFIRDDTKWSAGKKTALLVHGFPIFSQGKCRDGMVGLATHLSRARKVDGVNLPSYDAIYAVEYPTKYHILDTAAVLADIVNARYPSETKIDVFAHSMGGLVTRTAIEYPDVLLGTKNISNRVGHLVTMSTPHDGISSPVVDIFKEAFGELPVEIGDMDSKGLFMNMLNFTSSKKPQVSCDYYSIIGARSYRPKKYSEDKTGPFVTILMKMQDINHSVHDGLIDAASASYDLKEVCHGFKKTQLDLNHDYIKNHSEVFSAIDRWMIDDKWFGTALAKTESQPKVVSSSQGPQILLGKSRAEIEKIFGTTCLMLNTANTTYYSVPLDTTGDSYAYGSRPTKFYSTSINFYAYGKKWSKEWPKKPLNQVHSASITYENAMYDEQKQFYLKPDEVVPAQILNQPPSGIYRTPVPNTIAVVWFIAGKTYLMVLCDIPSCPLYTTKLVNGTKRYYANQNTHNVHAGYVSYFAYVDKIIKMMKGGSAYSDNVATYIITIDDYMFLFYWLETFSK